MTAAELKIEIKRREAFEHAEKITEDTICETCFWKCKKTQQDNCNAIKTIRKVFEELKDT